MSKLNKLVISLILIQLGITIFTFIRINKIEEESVEVFIQSINQNMICGYNQDTRYVYSITYADNSLTVKRNYDVPMIEYTDYGKQLVQSKIDEEYREYAIKITDDELGDIISNAIELRKGIEINDIKLQEVVETSERDLTEKIYNQVKSWEGTVEEYDKMRITIQSFIDTINNYSTSK